MMPSKNNERVLFVTRIVAEYSDGDNINPIGFRFDIFYHVVDLLLTDGVLYSSFDECSKHLSDYLVQLFDHKPSDPFIFKF